MSIRVGAVNYLNSKPLIDGLGEATDKLTLSVDLPSRLADQMAAGELDVGLIPVAEYFAAGDYTHIPNIGIASFGPVLSVTLFSRVPWDAIRSVALDEGSRTSAKLTRILLEQRHGLNPHYQCLGIEESADHAATDAVLLIGDRAMKACLPSFPYAFDLGQEWTDWTGLPMVFAIWAVRAGLELGYLEKYFHDAKKRGLERAGLIAEREAGPLGLDPGFCRRYLTNIIRYDLGPRELTGLARFRELASQVDSPVETEHENDRLDLVSSS